MVKIYDVETFVYSPVATVLRNTYPGIAVSSEYTDTPARFPSVTIIEADNSVLKKMSTKKIENASKLMFEVNIFSNKDSGAKLEARDIMGTIDMELEHLGFTRITMSPTPNLNDATIYRITARYEGIVMPEYGIDDTIYRIYTN